MGSGRSDALSGVWLTISTVALRSYEGHSRLKRHHETVTSSFFESLVKPSWMPPDWVFPTAWFTLWTLQVIAVGLLIGSDRAGRNIALALVAAQFVTALAWQSVVFGPGRLALSAIWLVLVLLLVVAATVAAWRVSTVAGVLLAPTIVWMSVATALGFSLWRLNPSA